MVIESLDNNKIKSLRKLKQKKYRDIEKLFLVEGVHLVNEAYKSGNLVQVILCENQKLDFDVDTIYVSKEVLKSLSELEVPYNIIGVCKYQEEKEINGNVLILDGIQDPGNLGTIIRSAVAFNIDTIFINNNTVDMYNSKVLRATQGMNFHINIKKVDINSKILELKKDNYKIYGTDVQSGIDIKKINKNEKYAIIMGNEGNGISNEIKKMCDSNIYINMNNTCESLNVAVATSIILYELNK